MELFSKLYGCYYRIVEQILKQANNEAITKNQMDAISSSNGFEESALTIVPKLVSGEWELLNESGKGLYVSKLGEIPKIPLTDLQKSWLKTLLQDRRYALFFSDEDIKRLEIGLSDIEALYQLEDFYYFDQYSDGDDFSDITYQKHFRMFVNAAVNKKVLSVCYDNKKGQPTRMEIIPHRIQYSQREDKFRAQCVRLVQANRYQGLMLNLARVKECETLAIETPKELNIDKFLDQQRAPNPVVIEISGERNSLERCMLHFANYEKKTEFDEEHNIYICSIFYDQQDEPELLIEILSFGPVIKVLEPDSFLQQVKLRVKRQYGLMYE